jgi:hypothetical protein
MAVNTKRKRSAFTLSFNVERKQVGDTQCPQ